MIKTAIPGLSALVIDQVLDLGATVRIVARTPMAAAACPECGQLSGRVHAYHERRLADLPIAGRAVTVQVRVRPLGLRGYARAERAEQLQRPPQYRETLVDPFRDHLRRRRPEEPGVAVTQLLTEIREQGYTGSANLLARYLNQGRADTERAAPSPRRLVSWLMSHPGRLPAHRRSHLDELLATCPHLTVLAAPVSAFADLLTARRSRDLDAWMAAVDTDGLPALQGFVHGLRMDLPAVMAGLTLPYSNGPIEGANTKVNSSNGRCTAGQASPYSDNESCSRRRTSPTTVSAPEPFLDKPVPATRRPE